MGKGPVEANIDLILRRLDRASPDSLLRSLAAELARVLDAQSALEGRLAAFESLQAMADRILEAGAVAVPLARYPDRLRLDASDASLDSPGFYALEHDGAGAPYRWTGPERHSSIQLFVDRTGPLAFTLTFSRLCDDAPPHLLRAFVDGQDVELKASRSGAVYEAQGVLPPRADHGGTVITFVLPKVCSPSESGSADKRILGFAFLALAVEPLRARIAPKLAASKGDAAIHAAE